MERVVEIDIVKEEDLFEKYNKKIISKNLINYLIEETPKLKKEDKLKVIINNEIEKYNCKELIIEGLKREYNKASLKNELNNHTQLSYLIVGLIILLFSTFIDMKLLEEIVLIIGWVFIWDLVEIEIITDMNNKKRRRKIKWLLNSEMLENK